MERSRASRVLVAALTAGSLAVGCSAEQAEEVVETGSNMLAAAPPEVGPADLIGREVAVPVHLRDGDELVMSPNDLLAFGETVFAARWTRQEGQGRPFGKGNDQKLTDPTSPLAFPHDFNRISGPVAGSCVGCHNTPRIGGGGDIVGNVFVTGNRFDFATFDLTDRVPIRGALDERGVAATWQTVADSRKTTGMFGSGFVEMLARQMTTDIRAQAAACALGSACPLSSKGIRFGAITHRTDGTWDVSRVEGLSPLSLVSAGAAPPSLVLRPLFQSGREISLREFSINSLTRLHGIQAEERFGLDVDQDEDGFVNEATRADVTALALFQAALPVPGRVIPREPILRAAVLVGEQLFASIGCTSCHVPALPLDAGGWIYSEPNPYNDPGNLRPSDGVPPVTLDLTSADLPPPRLAARRGVVMVPAYTDLKLHDITTGLPSCASHPELVHGQSCDGDVEALDQNQIPGTAAFFEGNSRFITRKLWGIANQHAFGHHGQYTTMREAVLAHNGEAARVKAAFLQLGAFRQDAIIEFLKSLQILPPGTPCRIVDDDYLCEAAGAAD